MKMVDVSGKERTERVAIATARLRMEPATVERIRSGKVEKGDVLAAARLAGVMAAKRTPDLVPLCHPIALAGVTVEVVLDEQGASIRAEVKTLDYVHFGCMISRTAKLHPEGGTWTLSRALGEVSGSLEAASGLSPWVHHFASNGTPSKRMRIPFS